MTTWKEMHFLHKDKNISWPGFSPRPYHKLAFEKPPCTDAKIMVSQKMRCPAEESARWHIWGYHTWLDVGRLPPIYRPRPDQPFDSNTWRWITAPRASGSVAEPPVPPPSHLDGNTYIRFIEGEALFVSHRHKERVLTRTKKEMRQCEQLKLRSDCRAPPLDTEGNIMPPKEFKRYKRPLSRKSPASCVQPEAVMPPSRDFWDHPCPSLEPHYQEAAVKFALKNSSLIYQEVVEKYQQLFLSGSKIRPCTPIS